MGGGRVPIRRAERPVVLGELARPVGRERHRSRPCGTGRHDVAVLIEDEKLGVVGEAIAHRIEVIGEPLEVDPGMDRLAVRQRDALEIFRDLVGAREHAQVVAQLLGPEIDFAQRLRAETLQLFRRFRLEGPLVFDVGNPHGCWRIEKSGGNSGLASLPGLPQDSCGAAYRKMPGVTVGRITSNRSLA